MSQSSQFISTRGEAPQTGFADVLLAGLAPDGGLYVPAAWPQFSAAEIAAFSGKRYQDVAFAILSRFVGDSFTAAELKEDIEAAYAGFTNAEIAPLSAMSGNRYLLELFHGPTFAFKDIALQILGRLFSRALTRRGGKATIVAATSGDTGSAAIAALGGLPNIEVFVLHPKGRVSEVQRRQMTTSGHANVHNIALEGSFDDAQGIVKGLFAEKEFAREISLTAVNSINFVRIAAQSVYYFTATAALGKPATFIVPTGNFGDIFAGYVAKQMGLPVERLVIATNVNDILARTLDSGRYEVRGVVATESPAMDIQVSSNFERLLFDVYGRDAGAIKKIMGELSSGGFAIAEKPLKAIHAVFDAGRADEAETLATICTVHQESGYLLDPHSAVGVAIARKRKVKTPYVALGTAHPAKFPDAVEKACGIRPALPPRFKDLTARKERFDVLPADLNAVARYVSERSRVGEGAQA